MQTVEIIHPSFQQIKRKSIGLIHRVYLTQLKNARQYIAFTKTKSEVRGGGRKPWRQKGTGNARAGSIRSPLWVGGGVTFGPKPHLVSKKINKKEKRLSILCALSLKKNHSFVIPELSLSLETKPSNTSFWKTKEIFQLLETHNISKSQKILFIVANPTECQTFVRATRNIRNITVIPANSLNLIVLLKTEKIVLTDQSLQKINSLYGNLYLL